MPRILKITTSGITVLYNLYNEKIVFIFGQIIVQ